MPPPCCRDGRRRPLPREGEESKVLTDEKSLLQGLMRWAAVFAGLAGVAAITLAQMDKIKSLI